MSLKSKKVAINQEDFEVREITVGKILPLLPRLNDQEQQQDAQLELMQDCIFIDDLAIGEAVSELGISTYLALAEVVMEVNGLSEGKD